MTSPNDLVSFINYLNSTWGLLASIPAFFPFASLLFRTMPLPAPFSRKLQAVAMTVIGCLFVVYFTFLWGRIVNTQDGMKLAMVFFLVAFILFFVSIRVDNERSPVPNDELILMILFALTSIFLTATFSILASIGFWGIR